MRPGDGVRSDEPGESDHIRFSRCEHRAVVTLSRPEHRNAFDLRMVRELDAALDRVEADDETRVVIITGNGPAFCAGADLGTVLEAMSGSVSDGESDDMAFLRPLWNLLVRLRDLPRPVIAAVNGACTAGGLELVLCCDLVIAARSARFSDAHARYGLLPGIGGAANLARAVGPFRAKELLFLAEFHTAERMADLGIVNRVVDDDDLELETIRLANELAARSPAGLRRMKQMVNAGLEMPWRDAARAEFAHLAACWGSGDFLEGTRAFAERRQPKFGDSVSE